MKVNIKLPSVEMMVQSPGRQGMFEQIEKCGRICYRSIPKGGESAEKFSCAMASSGHYAMLEHGTVYLALPLEYEHPIRLNPYSHYEDFYDVDGYEHGVSYITTNYRVIIENGWMNLMSYWCEPTPRHERRVSILFDTNIGVSREFNRHRVNSMAESSTRYCNYSKDKFGGAISVIEPTWLRDREAIINMTVNDKSLTDCFGEVCLGQDKNWDKLDYWLLATETANYCYQKLIELGCKPQEAREVLPLATNTQLVHTAFVSDWLHFIGLRAEDKPTNHPHPMAKELAMQVEKIIDELK